MRKEDNFIKETEFKDELTSLVQLEHPNLALFGLMLGSFVGMFSETSLNIALPRMMTALHVDTGTIQWLVTGYMLVIGIVMPLSSLLTRKFKTQRIVLFALSAFIVGALISAIASTFSVVLIGRMIQGIGTGLILPLMFSVAMVIFPPQKLGTIMGLCSLVIMFAPAIGPTLTGLMLNSLSWHFIFWLFIPFLLVSFVITAVYLKNTFQQSDSSTDIFSLLLSTIGFGGIVIGTSLASNLGWLSLPVAACLIVGIVAVGLYVARQTHLATPVLNVSVFKSKAFSIGTAMVILNFAIILASAYLLPMYLQRVLGTSTAVAGLVMLPGGLVNVVISGLAGRLYDTYGAKWLTRIGFVIVIISVMMFLMIKVKTAVWVIVLGNIVLMIGAPLVMSPAQSYGLNSLDKRYSADGSTILSTLQQIAGAVSTAIATSMLSTGFRQTPNAVGLTHGTHLGFIFVMIMAVLALIISVGVKKPVRSKDINVA